MPMNRPLSIPLLMLPLAALSVTGLTGCGQEDSPAATADSLTVSDAWVRASEDRPMTGAFGVITNAGDADLTIVSAQTDASEMTELHEVVMQDGEMVMREIDGGFVVPAGGEHVLEPGGDHVMIMNMTDPTEPGEDVEITLNLDDGSTYSYTAQVREAEVGDETYVHDNDKS